MVQRVLIIGRHNLFHDGLKRLLAEQSTLTVVGTAHTWEEARQIMAQKHPHILIVDHDSAQLRETDLAPLLENEEQDIKVIYLTLAQNKMIVHKRQQVADVTATDLLQALQAPSLGVEATT